MNNAPYDGKRKRVARDRGCALALGLLWAIYHGTAMAASSDKFDQALLSAFQNTPELMAQCALAAAATTAATVPQPLDDDDLASYRTRLAKTSAAAAREALRATEQTILLNAAIAYLDLLRDGALLELQRRNFAVVEESLRLIRGRLDAGEASRTDVTQGETHLRSVRAAVARAEGQFARSNVTYLRVIGVTAGKLTPAAPADRLIPHRLAEAIEVGRARHPDAGVATFGVEMALLQVKILEASPHRGAAEEPSIGQAQETLAQKRLDVDTARDRVQANIAATWDQSDATKSRILPAQALVAASEIGLNGQREKARNDGRSALDVLDAQQELVEARAGFLFAPRCGRRIEPGQARARLPFDGQMNVTDNFVRQV
jgi:outer membrane protein TolC